MPYNSSRLLYLLKLVGLDTRCSRHLTSTNVGICWSMPSASWSTLLHFLDQPAVAVRVAERHEAIVVGPRGIEAGGLSLRSEVERLAHIDPAIHELSASGFDTDVMRYMIVFHRYRNHSTNRDHSIPGADPAAARPASDIFSPTP